MNAPEHESGLETRSTLEAGYAGEGQARPAITPPPAPTLRRLFFGDDGLRAGWSLLLFVLLSVGLILGLQWLLVHTHLVPPPHRPTAAQRSADVQPSGIAIGDGLTVAGLCLAAFLMSLLERRPFTRYGFSGKRVLSDVALGLVWGFTFLSLLIGLLWLTHSIAFDGIALQGRAALAYAGKWAVVFLLVGLSEEFLFRGYLQYTLARGVAGIAREMDAGNRHVHAISFWVTAFIFSVVLFTLAHTGNPGETVAGVFAVGVAGAVFAFSLYRTGSLWWAVGFHTAWDWAQSFFYGTADSGTHSAGHFLTTHPQGSALLSGSSAGPEGSLLVIPVLLLVAVVIHVTLPRLAYPLTAAQTLDRSTGTQDLHST